VVVDKVDVTRRLIEPKDHPPIACDFHGPETLQLAFEWMQTVTGPPEILGRIGRIEICEDDPELRYYL
jgi:hypothetical protein